MVGCPLSATYSMSPMANGRSTTANEAIGMTKPYFNAKKRHAGTFLVYFWLIPRPVATRRDHDKEMDGYGNYRKVFERDRSRGGVLGLDF